MTKAKRGNESRLARILAGTVVDNKVVSKIPKVAKGRKTRDVQFTDGTEKRVNKEVLIDNLLITEGYQPTHSGKPLEWFTERRQLNRSKDKGE